MPREQVDEQVARDGRPVVGVVPPAEEADGIERALGRGAEEPVPVDRLGRGVGRQRVLPGADRRVAVVPRLDRVDRADGARP